MNTDGTGELRATNARVGKNNFSTPNTMDRDALAAMGVSAGGTGVGAGKAQAV